MNHEQLRWWAIREVGALHDRDRDARAHNRSLQKEVEDLKARMDTKAEAASVVSELVRLRGGVGEEFRTMRLEVTKAFQEMGGHVQGAFNQASAVEASFQSHVSKSFEEAVNALKWLEGQTTDHFTQLEAQVAALQAKLDAPPPPAPVGERNHTRRTAPAPALSVRQNLS